MRGTRPARDVPGRSRIHGDGGGRGCVSPARRSTLTTRTTPHVSPVIASGGISCLATGHAGRRRRAARPRSAPGGGPRRKGRPRPARPTGPGPHARRAHGNRAPAAHPRAAHRATHGIPTAKHTVQHTADHAAGHTVRGAATAGEGMAQSTRAGRRRRDAPTRARPGVPSSHRPSSHRPATRRHGTEQTSGIPPPPACDLTDRPPDLTDRRPAAQAKPWPVPSIG